MFDIFAMLLSSVASFLFPIFASYKALKTADPAQLTPWLMYWVVFSICLLVESWFSFILFWIPFYGYIRLFFFLYLILPQTQGARLLYEDKVHPFLQDNENTIDEFIATAHDRVKAAFVTYFRRATEYVKTTLLNMPATEREPASAQQAAAAAAAPQGYMQSLLARFSVPTTQWGSGAANTGNEFYNLLANAVSAVTTSATTGSGGPTNNSSSSSSSSSGNNNKRGNKGVSDSGVLIPPHLRGSAEKMSFIAAQRERLNILLRALDQEAQQIQRDGSRTTTTTTTRPGAFATDSGGIGDGNSSSEDDAAAARTSPSGLTALSKSRSETEFEKVEAESGAEDEVQLRRRYASSGSGGSWRAWAWGPGDAAAAGAHPGPKQD